MRVLLAGGNGFIGSNAFTHLTRLGHDVSSIDMSSSNNGKNSYSVDLTDKASVLIFADKCEKYDILIFLVGLAHAKGKGKELPVFEVVNFQTLVNLTEAFKTHDKLPQKIIFTSTISVYGERLLTQIYPEELDPKPFSPYAITKRQAEVYLKEQYADISWILRFAPVYSSSFTLNIDRRTKMRGLYYIIGSGEKQLSLCHIQNIMDTFSNIIENKVPARVYNVSDADAYSYNDLHQKHNARIIRIPQFIPFLLFLIGEITQNIFLKENGIKLCSDNIFPSKKLNDYVSLSNSYENI